MAEEELVLTGDVREQTAAAPGANLSRPTLSERVLDESLDRPESCDFPWRLYQLLWLPRRVLRCCSPSCCCCCCCCCCSKIIKISSMNFFSLKKNLKKKKIWIEFFFISKISKISKFQNIINKKLIIIIKHYFK